MACLDKEVDKASFLEDSSSWGASSFVGEVDTRKGEDIQEAQATMDEDSPSLGRDQEVVLELRLVEEKVDTDQTSVVDSSQDMAVVVHQASGSCRTTRLAYVALSCHRGKIMDPCCPDLSCHSHVKRHDCESHLILPQIYLVIRQRDL